MSQVISTQPKAKEGGVATNGHLYNANNTDQAKECYAFCCEVFCCNYCRCDDEGSSTDWPETGDDGNGDDNDYSIDNNHVLGVSNPAHHHTGDSDTHHAANSHHTTHSDTHHAGDSHHTTDFHCGGGFDGSGDSGGGDCGGFD